MKSFQEINTILETILAQGEKGSDVRPQLDAFFTDVFIAEFPSLLAASNKNINAIETQYKFYTLLNTAFLCYQHSSDGRMLQDKRKLDNLRTQIGKPLLRQIQPYINALSEKQITEARAQHKTLQSLFQSLVSFNLANIQNTPLPPIDELIVRTAPSSPEHTIMGIESGGHSTIEARKKDGTSLFFSFYAYEAAEKLSLATKVTALVGAPSPDKKVIRFVELDQDPLSKKYKGSEIHIPCDGKTLDINKAMDYLIEQKFQGFDPKTWQPMRKDYQFYNQNCSTFVREALMKAQGDLPIPYNGATVLNIDTPMAVGAYAQQLREKVLFEETKKIRRPNDAKDDKAYLIEAIQSLEQISMENATQRDSLLMSELIHRLQRVVSVPVDLPFFYQDLQEIIYRIDTLEPRHSAGDQIHSILTTASQSLSAYRQQIEIVDIKADIATATRCTQKEIDSLKSPQDCLNYINARFPTNNKDHASLSLKTIESIRGKLYEQIYFKRDAHNRNDFIKDISRWILPNLLFEDCQPSMSNLIEVAKAHLSIPSTKPFHSRENQTKQDLHAIHTDANLTLPEKLIGIQRVIKEQKPSYWSRLASSSMRHAFAAYEQLEKQTKLLCVMDALVSGKITPAQWLDYLEPFKDWLPDDVIEHWGDYMHPSSYSNISAHLVEPVQLEAVKDLVQHHVITEPNAPTPAPIDDYHSEEDDEYNDDERHFRP